MIDRFRAIPSAIALVGALGIGLLAVAPAVANGLPISSSLVSSVSALPAADTTAPDTTDTNTSTDTGTPQQQVLAETGTDSTTVLILVGGLGVLLASIYLVVRSTRRTNES
jgi:LPXTG-motif cell wall-anchored protein